MRQFRWALCQIFLVAVTACGSVGPDALRRDQVDYAEALLDASRRQLLLNIVRLRYFEGPALISVTQLVAGYNRSGTLSFGSDFFRDDFALSDDVTVGVSGSFTDNPTVTYAPVKGSNYARVLLTPVTVSDLFALIDGGAPTEVVLGVALRTINGMRNRDLGVEEVIPSDPKFHETIALLAELVANRAVGFHFYPSTQERSVTLLVADDSTGQLPPRTKRLLELLGLSQDRREFSIRYGFGRGTATDVTVDTRSLLQILSNLAADIDVPTADVEAGFTPDVVRSAGLLTLDHGLIAPLDSFVAAKYRGNWFWINQDDLRSKRVFGVLQMIFSLFDRSEGGGAPVLAIPTR